VIPFSFLGGFLAKKLNLFNTNAHIKQQDRFFFPVTFFLQDFKCLFVYCILVSLICDITRFSVQSIVYLSYCLIATVMPRSSKCQTCRFLVLSSITKHFVFLEFKHLRTSCGHFWLFRSSHRSRTTVLGACGSWCVCRICGLHGGLVRFVIPFEYSSCMDCITAWVTIAISHLICRFNTFFSIS